MFFKKTGVLEKIKQLFLGRIEKELVVDLVDELKVMEQTGEDKFVEAVKFLEGEQTSQNQLHTLFQDSPELKQLPGSFDSSGDDPEPEGEKPPTGKSSTRGRKKTSAS